MRIMKTLSVYPDNFGATFSLLCVIHCFATPLLFITQSHLIIVPLWWQGLNYLFLALSLVAISYSAQNSSSQLIKVLLFVSWSFLAFLLISEEFELLHLPEPITYFTGFTLAFLHMYNKKYCKCDGQECCNE